MSGLPDRAPTIRVVAMPADANPYGDIFGGWLMGQMDIAAGIVASRHARGRAVTIAVEAWRRARNGDEACRVTQARFVFVATDGERRPRAVAGPARS